MEVRDSRLKKITNNSVNNTGEITVKLHVFSGTWLWAPHFPLKVVIGTEYSVHAMLYFFFICEVIFSSY